MMKIEEKKMVRRELRVARNEEHGKLGFLSFNHIHGIFGRRECTKDTTEYA